MDEMQRDYLESDVVGKNGERIGSVDALWADEQTDEPKFAAVKTGWLLGRSHIVPLENAELDRNQHVIRVPYSERQIRDAPHFPEDETISQSDERSIFAHYRGQPPSSEGGPPSEGIERGRRTSDVNTGDIEMPLREEELNIGKREVEGDAIRLRKVVRTEVVNQPVELKREHYEVERVPASELKGTTAGEGRPFEEEDILLRERREEPVVEKSERVVGGVRAHREEETERRDVKGEIRREDVDIDREDRREGRRS